MKTKKSLYKVFPQMKNLWVLLKKAIIKARNHKKMNKKWLKNQIYLLKSIKMIIKEKMLGISF